MWKYCFLLALVITPIVKSDINGLMKSFTDLNSRRDANATQHLVGFLAFVFLGQTGAPTTSVFDLIDQAPNDVTMDEMLIVASQKFIEYLISKDYEPEEYEAQFAKWISILAKLREQGTSAVSLEELRPFINMLRPQNLYAFWNRNERATYVNNTVNRLNYYIYNVYLGQIKDPVCRMHTTLWFQSIQKGEGWALQMFDSVGKPGTGLANANINWVGSYKQCRKISVKNKDTPFGGYKANFNGRYCRATLGFPPTFEKPDTLPLSDDVGLEIGLCVPSPCDNEDVKSIMLNTLKLMTVQDLFNSKNVKVLCDYDEPKSNAYKAYLTLFLLLIGFVVLATVFDGVWRLMYEEKEEKETKDEVSDDKLIEMKEKITGSGIVHHIAQPPKKKKPSRIVQFILNCSMYTNSERLFRTDNGGQFGCLNGIRAISMMWIIFSHTFNYLGDLTFFFLVSNLLDIQELQEEWYAQLIINGMYGVDTFFLMSAFLITLGMLKKLNSPNGMSLFEWFYYYIHRYWRLLPPYAIIIAIYIYIMPWVGNGPLWYSKDFPMKNEDCHNYWWSYLLFVNNFVPGGKGVKCMGYLWYVSNDYQLYAITPIFLIVLYKFPIAGLILLAVTLFASVGLLGFLTANLYAHENGNIVAVLVNIWDDIYTKPYCRAGPWIIGIYLGYIFYKNKRVHLNKFIVVAGWLLSAAFGISAVFGGYTNHGRGLSRMSSETYGAYFSLTRVSFPLAVAWVIYACHYGYGGAINKFLSSKFFLPLTRISYVSYLIHPVIMVTYMFSQRGLLYATEITLIYLFIGHMILTFLFGYFFHLFFEQPFIALEKLVLPMKGKDH